MNAGAWKWSDGSVWFDWGSSPAPTDQVEDKLMIIPPYYTVQMSGSASGEPKVPLCEINVTNTQPGKFYT